MDATHPLKLPSRPGSSRKCPQKELQLSSANKKSSTVCSRNSTRGARRPRSSHSQLLEQPRSSLVPTYAISPLTIKTWTPKTTPSTRSTRLPFSRTVRRWLLAHQPQLIRLRNLVRPTSQLTVKIRNLCEKFHPRKRS